MSEVVGVLRILPASFYLSRDKICYNLFISAGSWAARGGQTNCEQDDARQRSSWKTWAETQSETSYILFFSFCTICILSHQIRLKPLFSKNSLACFSTVAKIFSLTKWRPAHARTNHKILSKCVFINCFNPQLWRMKASARFNTVAEKWVHISDNCLVVIILYWPFIGHILLVRIVDDLPLPNYYWKVSVYK